MFGRSRPRQLWFRWWWWSSSQICGTWGWCKKEDGSSIACSTTLSSCISFTWHGSADCDANVVYDGHVAGLLSHFPEHAVSGTKLFSTGTDADTDTDTDTDTGTGTDTDTDIELGDSDASR